MHQLQGEEGQRHTAAKSWSWDPEQAVQLPEGGSASLKLTVRRDVRCHSGPCLPSVLLPAPFCPPLWLCQKHFLQGTFSSTRAEPLFQHSQGPQCYCFQLKKKNISSSPSSFPSPLPALPCVTEETCGRGWGAST